eukprot:gene24100-biopygen1324
MTPPTPTGQRVRGRLSQPMAGHAGFLPRVPNFVAGATKGMPPRRAAPCVWCIPFVAPATKFDPRRLTDRKVGWMEQWVEETVDKSIDFPILPLSHPPTFPSINFPTHPLSYLVNGKKARVDGVGKWMDGKVNGWKSGCMGTCLEWKSEWDGKGDAWGSDSMEAAPNQLFFCIRSMLATLGSAAVPWIKMLEALTCFYQSSSPPLKPRVSGALGVRMKCTQRNLCDRAGAGVRTCKVRGLPPRMNFCGAENCGGTIHHCASAIPPPQKFSAVEVRGPCMPASEADCLAGRPDLHLSWRFSDLQL